MKSKRNILFAVLGFVLATAGGALAAWILLTGVTGTGGGKVGSSQISPAVTLTPHFQAGDVLVIPGTTGDVMADVVNSNVTASETVTALTVQSITASPTCNTSGLSFTPDSNFVGSRVIAAGATLTHTRVGSLTAAANLDPACANAALTITFTGTTSP
jgi:hypothetical protein